MPNSPAVAALAEPLDVAVARVLRKASIEAPPVDVIQLARSMGISVVFDASQQPRGRTARLAGRTSIFIRPDERMERTQWTVAHEMGEILAHEIVCDFGAEPTEIDPRTREQTANLAAARLLLPTNWFTADADEAGGDLLILKHRYTTASHELIAFRLLDLPLPTVITVFDQGRQTRRQGNLTGRSEPLDRFEQACWLDVRRFGRSQRFETIGRVVQGWPIHEPGWQREILRTTCFESENQE
ncbi:MAG: ImmA/IrrE family metallo-endopeptidase [Planctomycetaceae bacterium]|nr:ImmA/IrrE family metallo-endopeptidase [Planctomycetaceae bacterium]